jgi:hypothetical protein
MAIAWAMYRTLYLFYTEQPLALGPGVYITIL